MSRTMMVDYAKIKETTIKFRDLLSQGSEARLTTTTGTDLRFFLAGREAIAGTGILREKGSYGNLPGGEACIAPLAGQTSGVVIIDGSMAGIGAVRTPIRMLIEDGYVTQISGGAEAEALSGLLQDKGKEATNIAELGIGANEKAILSGNPLEDEKALGTVHIAIGDNKSFGGKVEASVHLDGIMKNPILVIDGRTVIKNGTHLI